MLQPNEGLGDALLGDQRRGGRKCALGSFHILTTHMFNPETILREQLGGPACPPLYFGLSPSQSTSRSSCTMTQLQTEAAECQKEFVAKEDEDVRLICPQADTGVA